MNWTKESEKIDAEIDSPLEHMMTNSAIMAANIAVHLQACKWLTQNTVLNSHV